MRSTEAVKANLIKGSLDGRLSVEDQALFRRLQYTQDRKGEWSERACFLTALKLTQSHQDVQVGMADASLLTYVFKYILKAEVLRKVTDKYHTHQGINEVFETLQP